ncbi:hypothetical protein OFDDKENP_00164 [Aeromonas phage B614]|nr:hypothetical protein OFDDKENP_00164 [Aeromonas phage B614]UYD58108.1 hypothetical protein JNEOFJEA_00011 [Aeromonas phage UP87]UYD58472.1 hypothetical protein IPAKJDPM_00129 [Aeromonas phage avDM14-QBC]UYD58688.1 hypothetical protein HNNIDBEH_00095 [Aeromonas phage avDM10-HWA]UYD59009.1 hypothetical protein OFOPOMKI_00159 [Aeromonas phage avDM7-IJDJ]UYD59821.1 hypothetical protein LEHPIFIF_00048 [Aeromonas phage avDM9-HANS]
MKAQFKSPEARQQFIDLGEKEWATSSDPMSNNNRKIAYLVGMKEFDVKPCGSPFVGWYDIYIDGKQFDSISSREVGYFDFRE